MKHLALPAEKTSNKLFEAMTNENIQVRDITVALPTNRVYHWRPPLLLQSQTISVRTSKFDQEVGDRILGRAQFKTGTLLKEFSRPGYH